MSVLGEIMGVFTKSDVYYSLFGAESWWGCQTKGYSINHIRRPNSQKNEKVTARQKFLLKRTRYKKTSFNFVLLRL